MKRPDATSKRFTPPRPSEEAVDEALSKQGWHAISIEGLPRGQWVLLDFVDVVVHVFLAEQRALYDLDGLWMDAKRVRVPGV